MEISWLFGRDHIDDRKAGSMDCSRNLWGPSLNKNSILVRARFTLSEGKSCLHHDFVLTGKDKGLVSWVVFNGPDETENQVQVAELTY